MIGSHPGGAVSPAAAGAECREARGADSRGRIRRRASGTSPSPRARARWWGLRASKALASPRCSTSCSARAGRDPAPRSIRTGRASRAAPRKPPGGPFASCRLTAGATDSCSTRASSSTSAKSSSARSRALRCSAAATRGARAGRQIAQLRIKTAFARHARQSSLRGQSAEGRDRQVARDRAAGDPARRSHARCRRRRQARDL